MSKTFKDRPDRYKEKSKYKPKEGKRFVSSKGREKDKLRDYVNSYKT